MRRVRSVDVGARYAYDCPLYLTAARNAAAHDSAEGDLVREISLPCDEPAERWALRSVALLVQPDEPSADF
jgi:hypothetical protein